MIRTVKNINFKEFDWSFDYQKDLTEKLDKTQGDFDQKIINEIVLWKVNRYAHFSDEAFKLLNQINTNDSFNQELTIEILHALLKLKGIQLPMASTILRFKNPNLYQIIDQRVYRILYGEVLTLSTGNSNNSISKNIELYLKYLECLKNTCIKLKIPFKESDRILYEADKHHNSKIKLKNYG